LVDFGHSQNRLETGISVGTWAPHNWFHWLIDILPSVFLARNLPSKYDDFPILLPTIALEKPSWREVLDLVIGDRTIQPLSSRQTTVVQSLVVIDSPTNPGPLNVSGSEPRQYYSAHSPAVKAYQQHLLQVSGPHRGYSRSKRAIFIARRGGSRPYDESRFSEILGRLGFETVYLEDLTLKQTVEVMQGASAVIGPHGAGWANSLFCRDGTPALMWTWAEAERHNWFANVAEIANLEFRVHVGGSYKKHGFHPTPDELERLVIDWLSTLETRIN
jgi:capsular polysaccharide biosynthesis protein